MANCKSCGTRTGTRDRNCPNCGRTLTPGSSLSGQKPLDPDLTSPSQEAVESHPEPVAQAKPEPKPKPKPEPELEPEVETMPEPKAEPKPAPEPAPEVELSEAVEEAASGSPFTLGPEELLARISREEIDLLAEDAEGALVVVKVAGADAGQVVGSVLEQMGWVSKHIAHDERPVRALVLLEPPAPELGYAARAVADSISFKTWRITVAVDDVTL
jgi:hypothetical protein